MGWTSAGAIAGYEAVAAAGVAAGGAAYSTHESNKAAEAAQAVKPAALPSAPLDAEESSAAQAQKANLLSQSAGGTLLSDPTQNGSRQIGSATKGASTLLGTG